MTIEPRPDTKKETIQVFDLTDDGRIAVRTSWDDLPWFLTPAAADELADTLKSFAAVSRARHGQAGEGTGEG